MMKKQTETTLFIGNGLNRLYGVKSWSVLLSHVDVHQSIQFKTLPFTLQFEVIMSQLLAQNPTTSYGQVKGLIRDALNQPEPEGLLGLVGYFTDLPVTNIITTNYDYTIEHALQRDFDHTHYRSDSLGDEREVRYSTYRYVNLEERRIYHIHGELKRLQSICIGFEHYAGSVQVLRDTVYELDNITASHAFEDLFKPTDSSRNYWLKTFLNTDVHMVGYGLDYSEIDIWWAIVYRSTLINIYPGLITHTLTYYGFNMDDEKIESLKHLNVNVVNQSVNFEDSRAIEAIYKQIAQSIEKTVVEYK